MKRRRATPLELLVRRARRPGRPEPVKVMLPCTGGPLDGHRLALRYPPPSWGGLGACLPGRATLQFRIGDQVGHYAAKFDRAYSDPTSAVWIPAETNS